MFKFLKPAKPGASKVKPAAAKPKPEAAAQPRSAPTVRPPHLKTSAPGPVLTAEDADLRYKQQPVMTPERQALIQQALSVHRAQQEVFADKHLVLF